MVWSSVRGQFSDGQSMNIGNILITTDGDCGDLAGSSVRFTLGTPADTVHIKASFALRRKRCFQHGDSFGAASHRTACRQIFVVTRGEEVEIHRRTLLQYGDCCIAQRKV